MQQRQQLQPKDDALDAHQIRRVAARRAAENDLGYLHQERERRPHRETAVDGERPGQPVAHVLCDRGAQDIREKRQEGHPEQQNDQGQHGDRDEQAPHGAPHTGFVCAARRLRAVLGHERAPPRAASGCMRQAGNFLAHGLSRRCSVPPIEQCACQRCASRRQASSAARAGTARRSHRRMESLKLHAAGRLGGSCLDQPAADTTTVGSEAYGIRRTPRRVELARF